MVIQAQEYPSESFLRPCFHDSIALQNADRAKFFGVAPTNVSGRQDMIPFG